MPHTLFVNLAALLLVAGCAGITLFWFAAPWLAPYVGMYTFLRVTAWAALLGLGFVAVAIAMRAPEHARRYRGERD